MASSFGCGSRGPGASSFFSRVAVQDGTMEAATAEPLRLDRTGRKATPRNTESKVLFDTSIYQGTNRRARWSWLEKVGGLFGPNSDRRVWRNHARGAAEESVPETESFPERADHHVGDAAALSRRPSRPQAEEFPDFARRHPGGNDAGGGNERGRRAQFLRSRSHRESRCKCLRSEPHGHHHQ